MGEGEKKGKEENHDAQKEKEIMVSMKMEGRKVRSESA